MGPLLEGEAPFGSPPFGFLGDSSSDESMYTVRFLSGLVSTASLCLLFEIEVVKA